MQQGSRNNGLQRQLRTSESHSLEFATDSGGRCESRGGSGFGDRLVTFEAGYGERALAGGTERARP
ncbi:hypothetical protein GCM10008944_20650 [Cytobacillus oceanisediminis]